MQGQCTTTEVVFWSIIGIVLILLIAMGMREIFRDRGGGESTTSCNNKTTTQAERRGNHVSYAKLDPEVESKKVDLGKLRETLSQMPQKDAMYARDAALKRLPTRLRGVDSSLYLRPSLPMPQNSKYDGFGQSDV